MKAKLLYPFIILIYFSSNSFSQVEYLVQVNPATCNFTIIDSIPIIKWIEVGSSTFDQINKRFVFTGLDNGSGKYLCSVDATNGNTVSIPLMTSNFAYLKFDNSTGILYGLHWISSLSNAEFVSINPANLSYTVIRPINLTFIGSDYTFDDNNHRYIIAAGDSVGTQRLFSFDALTGNIISNPPISGVNGIQYDNTSGNIYGLHWDNPSQTEYFVSVNSTSGSLTTINSISSVSSIVMGYPTFDEINKRYTFYGMDNSNNRYLFTLDATNGNVVTNPLFPVLPSPYNLIETRYDNSPGNLYALHWGPVQSFAGIEEHNKDLISIFPNPFSTQTTLQTDKFLKNASLTVYNTFGQAVQQIENIEGQTIVFPRNNLPSGMYFIHLLQDNKIISFNKFVIADK
jgi:hypothetical protein